MDQDSIREFLEKRSRGEVNDDFLPPITPKAESNAILPKKKFALRKYVLAIAALFTAVALVYFGVSVYEKIRVSSYEDNDRIVESVRKLVEIDTLEDPKVVTVTNADSIRGQTFFKEALNGDKLLIFETSKKAVLYRPSTDKIISIAPLN